MKQELSKNLKNRHIQMIALGGLIGTGLFFGTAKSIQTTGPSILLAYLLGGIIIYIIMRALGEMTVFSPSAGSFGDYANNYLGKYAGFVAGWTAWFEYTVVCMVELTAVTFFLDYWIPGLPHWLVCLGLLLLFGSIQLLSVKLFGEFEFWFAGIKVTVIIAMLIFSGYLILFNHTVQDNAVANIRDYSNFNIFFNNGLKGFLFSFVMVVFSFGGIEFVSIAAGEAKNPSKTIPTAIRSVILRIVLFYILTIVAILALYPYEKLNTNISPFVDVFAKIGVSQAANIMNFVAITAALSAFNSCLYAGSRMLFSLAKQNNYGKLSEISSSGIPRKAVFFTGAAVLIGVIVNYLFPEHAIIYLLTIATCAILTCWFIILITQIQFRKKVLEKLNYKLMLYPYSNIFAMLMLLVVMAVMLMMDDMRMSVLITPIWIVFLSVIYKITYKKS